MLDWHQLHLLLMRLSLGLLLLLLAQFPSHFRLVFFFCLVKLRKTYKNRSFQQRAFRGFRGSWAVEMRKGQEKKKKKKTQTVRVIPLDFRKGYWPHRAEKMLKIEMMEGRQTLDRKYKRNELLGNRPPSHTVLLRHPFPSPSVIGVLAAHSMVHKSVVNYSNADN